LFGLDEEELRADDGNDASLFDEAQKVFPGILVQRRVLQQGGATAHVGHSPMSYFSLNWHPLGRHMPDPRRTIRVMRVACPIRVPETPFLHRKPSEILAQCPPTAVNSSPGRAPPSRP